LLHKSEIRKLSGAVAKEGLTVVPTKAYLRGSLVKLELAVAKGKKLYDKRDSLMKKEHEREIQKAFKERNK
jgi:SsrA-binding protein